MAEYPQEVPSLKKTPSQSRMCGGLFASVIVGILTTWGGAAFLTKPALAFESTASKPSTGLVGVDAGVVAEIDRIREAVGWKWKTSISLLPPSKPVIRKTEVHGFENITGELTVTSENFEQIIRELWHADPKKSDEWVKILIEWRHEPKKLEAWKKHINLWLQTIQPEAQSVVVIRRLVAESNTLALFENASPTNQGKYADPAIHSATWIAQISSPVTKINSFFVTIDGSSKNLPILTDKQFDDLGYRQAWVYATRLSLAQIGSKLGLPSLAVPPMAPVTGKPGGSTPATSGSTAASPTIVTKDPGSAMTQKGAITDNPSSPTATETLTPRTAPPNIVPTAPVATKTSPPAPVGSITTTAVTPLINPQEISAIDAQIARDTAQQEEVAAAAADAKSNAQEHETRAKEQAELAAAAKKQREEQEAELAALQKEISEREKVIKQSKEDERAATERMKQEQKAAQDAATLATQQEAQKKAIADKIAADKAYKAAVPAYQSSWLIPFNTTAIALRQKLASEKIDVPSVNRDINELRKLRSAHDTLVRNWNPVAKDKDGMVRTAYEQLQREIGMHRSPNTPNLWTL